MKATDVEACRQLLTEDAAFWVPQSAAARSGFDLPIRGREEVINLMVASGFYRYDTMSIDVHHVVSEGDMVAVHHTMSTKTSGGTDYSNQYAYLLRFEEGRVAEVWEHLDTAYAYSRFKAGEGLR
jgi:ketosteroid isomerase-like protein